MTNEAVSATIHSSQKRFTVTVLLVGFCSGGTWGPCWFEAWGVGFSLYHWSSAHASLLHNWKRQGTPTDKTTLKKTGELQTNCLLFENPFKLCFDSPRFSKNCFRIILRQCQEGRETEGKRAWRGPSSQELVAGLSLLRLFWMMWTNSWYQCLKNTIIRWSGYMLLSKRHIYSLRYQFLKAYKKYWEYK